jgi:DNA recombination protein RmuC
MIVDSKVSLTAYEKYINEEDDELKRLLKRTCKSIKRHVEQLGKTIKIYTRSKALTLCFFHSYRTRLCDGIKRGHHFIQQSFEKILYCNLATFATLRTIDNGQPKTAGKRFLKLQDKRVHYMII